MYSSCGSYVLNSLMMVVTLRLLTIFNAITLSLTGLTGIFDIHVDFPFLIGNSAFIIIMTVMVVSTIGLLIFFNRRTNC